LLLLDKPGGCTSNRALQRVRRLYAAAKAGHTGSLDPLATGMLPIWFGHATRLSQYLLDAHKSYEVVAELGAATDTADADGTVVERAPAGTPPASADVAAALDRFRGTFEQVPPMYSALKHEGRRLYEIARSGESVERAPRTVTVHAISLDRYVWPELAFTVSCSKGTYVRTLVCDVAAALGTLGFVKALRRTEVGPFTTAGMHTETELETLAGEAGLEGLDGVLLPTARMLTGMPAVEVDAGAAGRIGQGGRVPADPAWPPGRVAIHGPAGLVAVGDVVDGELKPRVVLPP
jgi:tRNA pseudouridine55 synthase